MTIKITTWQLNLSSVKFLILSSTIILFFIESGCSQTTTPKEYLYLDSTCKLTYNVNKELLTAGIKILISKKSGPYYPNEFDEKTQIFIDTILCSPKKDKIVALVITKNSNDKLLSQGNKSEYHYCANCFIGTKDSTNWHLNWFKTLNLTGFDDYINTSNGIREIYFNELSTLKDRNGDSIYKYNINDTRFWEGPV